MIELDAKQVSDEIVEEGIVLAQDYIDRMCDIQTDYIKDMTITSREVVFNKPSSEVLEYVRGLLRDDIKNDMIGNTKVSFNERFNEFQHAVLKTTKDMVSNESFKKNSEDYTDSKIKMAVFDVVKDAIRDRTLQQDLRVDNRSMDQIRPLYTEIDTVPRVHGSGLFRR